MAKFDAMGMAHAVDAPGPLYLYGFKALHCPVYRRDYGTTPYPTRNVRHEDSTPKIVTRSLKREPTFLGMLLSRKKIAVGWLWLQVRTGVHRT